MGTIYKIKSKEYYRKLSNKEMEKLWNEEQFLSYVKDKREYYMEHIYDGIRYLKLPECYCAKFNL